MACNYTTATTKSTESAATAGKKNKQTRTYYYYSTMPLIMVLFFFFFFLLTCYLFFWIFSLLACQENRHRMSYGPINPCRKTKLCTQDNTPPGQYWEPECAEHDYPTLHRDYLSYPSIHPDTEKQQQGHRKNQPDHVRLEAPLLSWCSHVGLKTILLLDSNLPALLRSFPQPWNRFGF